MTFNGSSGVNAQVFDAVCSGCHFSGSGLPVWTNYATADANIALIVDRINRAPGDPLLMPQGGPKMSATLLNLVSSWDSAGEPDQLTPTTVTSVTVDSITKTSARVFGTIDPRGASTTGDFQYGVSPTVTTFNSSDVAMGSGGNSTDISFNRTLTGLSCGTTYAYRARGVNAEGTTTGTTRTFTTSACSNPVITEGTSESVVMSEDSSPTPFSLTLHATDADGGTLTWSIFSQASNGTATASGTGSSKVIGYTPNPNFNGADSFQVRVTDNTSLTDTITVNVTVNAVNDAPVITEGASESVVMSEDGTPTPFSLTLNATDVDTGATLTWSISSAASNGTATASGTGTSKAIGYTPNANYNGSDSFIVEVSDGSLTDTITVNVTVNSVADAPVIAEGVSTGVVMSEDGSPTPFSLTLNATDGDLGTTLTWSILSPASDGTATASGTGASKMIGYTPDANFNGADSFVVQVSDGTLTDAITVNVTVNAVNDAPVIAEGASTGVVMSEDGSPTPFSLTLNASDVDSGTLTWSILTQASNGTAGASGAGTSKAISYTPAIHYNGADSFVVRVSDGSGGTDDITVNVTINAVDDAPIIAEGLSVPVFMSEDSSPTSFSLTLNASDSDNDTLTWSILSNGSNGNATASGTGESKEIGYTPNANYFGVDSFVVRVNDGGLTDDITVNVTIDSVNDVPLVSTNTGMTILDGASVAINNAQLAATDNDTSDTASVLTYTVTALPTNGTLALNGTPLVEGPGLGSTFTQANIDNGEVEYTDAGSASSDSFTFNLKDDDNAGPDGITFNITISPNAPPVVTAGGTLNYTENQSPQIIDGSITLSDLEGNDIIGATIQITANYESGSDVLSFTNQSGITVQSNTGDTLTLTGTATLAEYQAALRTVSYSSTSEDPSLAPRTVTFVISDADNPSSGATSTINVSRLNDAPASADRTVNIDEDTPRVLVVADFSFNDLDSADSLQSVQIMQLPAAGALELSGVPVTLNQVIASADLAGNLVFTPGLNESGSPYGTLQFTVSDGLASSSPANTLTINVGADNDAPQPVGGTVVLTATDENAVLAGVSVSVGFTDAEDNDLDYSLTSGSLPVGVSLDSASGDLVGVPTVPGNYGFSVTATETDGSPSNLSSAPQAFSLVVNEAVNDTPVATGGTIALAGADENAALSVSVAGDFSDEDNNDLDYTVTAGSLPEGVSLDTATGELNGTPTLPGDYAFSITATETDGNPVNLSSPPQEYSWQIIETVNDAPVAAGGTITLPVAVEAIALSGVGTADAFTDEEGNTLNYNVTSGSLPNGVSLNAVSGELTGAPTINGVFNFGITATETDGVPGDLSSAEQAFSLTVTEVNDAPVTVGGTVMLPAVIAGDPVAGVSVTSAFSDEENNTLTYFISGGTLPSGVTLNVATGALEGIPMSWSPPAFDFNVVATETNGVPGNLSSVAQAFSLAVNIIDTDADTVPDFLDNCPLDANLDQLNNDVDSAGDVCDDDDDNDGMPDAFEIDNGFDPFDSTDAAEDADNDGRSNLEEFLAGGNPNSDDVPPAFSGVQNIVVDASGYLTPVELGKITAADVVSGSVGVSIESVLGETSLADVRRGLFRTGRTVITRSAIDSSLNVAIVEQTIDVRPLANFAPDLIAAEGGTVQVVVLLNGVAPLYPVTLDYTVSGSSDDADHNAVDGTVTITAGTEGIIDIDINPDTVNEGDETLVLTLSDPVNAALGGRTTHTVTIVEGNAPPTASLLTQQGMFTGPLVVADRGLSVTVMAAVNDPNAGSSFSYEWSGELTQTNAPGGSTFEFDPAGLAGIYTLTLTVTDNNGAATTIELLLNIKPTAPVLTSVDSDADGIADDLEGYADSDGDGVPDHLDAFEAIGEAYLGYNQTGNLPASKLLQTEPGLGIRLGAIALHGNASGILVDKSQITGYATLRGMSLSSSLDNMVNLGGLYDFEVYGLQPGGSANVVIPLLSKILEGSVYRKFSLQNGWRDFSSGGGNAIASARSVSGFCPAPGHASYRSGLNVFDDCLQLTLVDGGPNDADGQADGVIRDPGGVAVADVTPAHETPEPDDGSGGGSLHPWLLFGLFGWWVAMLRRRRMAA